MNFKKNVVIFTILICIFFSISCVVAGDVNDTVVTTYENQVIGNTNDLINSSQEDLVSSSEEGVIASSQEDLVSSSEEGVIASSQEDLLSSSKKGTFTDLQKIIYAAPNGATITLDKDYSYDQGFNFGKGIIIAKNLTINGNGHTLDGLSQSRILFVLFGLKENNKVTLNNIVFKNGYTKLYGGAIFNFADLTVNKCTFEKNYADTTAGAICSIGSLNCKYSKFNKNIANGDAGAIFSLNFKNEVQFFRGLQANAGNAIGNGTINEREIIQALMMDYSIKPQTDYISNCWFTYNVALGRGGGAVYAFTHIRIASSIFTSNQANQDGGAVYAAKDLIIKNSKFTKNIAGVYGGAVYFKFHDLSGHYDGKGNWISDVKLYTSLIKNCVFTGNVAKDRGAAIYGFKFSSMPKLEAAHAVKCTFIDNIAASEGNEIYGGDLKNCVLKNTLTLSTVKVKKSAKNLVLTVKLKKGSKPLKNQKVSFKFNGVNYKAYTNKKGIAKVIIDSSVLKKLKVGKIIKYQARYGKFHDVISAKVYK